MDNNTKDKKNLFFRLLSDRTACTLTVTVVLIIVMGSLRPDKPQGVSSKRFWADKMSWRECADMVITGDSRTLMSVSPTEIAKVFPGTKVRNYGFGANWYSNEYLEAIEKCLFPNSKEKRIFMGITPHSLTDRRNDTCGTFMDMYNYTGRQFFKDKYFAELLDFTEPMSFNEAIQGLFPATAPSWSRKHFYKNGFVAVNKKPLKKNEIDRYKRLFEERNVSEQIISNIIEYVEKWTSEGIIVYGFAIPSCQEMIDVENEYSGFDEALFVKAFEAAGGVWIAVNKTGYVSFDGSHLQDADENGDNGAYRFSADFAGLIEQYEHEKN